MDPTGDLGIRTLGLGFRYLQTERAPSTLVSCLLSFESSRHGGSLGALFSLTTCVSVTWVTIFSGGGQGSPAGEAEDITTWGVWLFLELNKGEQERKSLHPPTSTHWTCSAQQAGWSPALLEGTRSVPTPTPSLHLQPQGNTGHNRAGGHTSLLIDYLVDWLID